MLDYAALCILVLMAATLWTLARRLGWSYARSAFAALCALILPICVSFVALIRPEFVRVQEMVVTIASIVPLICLLALAKSVAVRRSSEPADAPR